MSDDSQSQSDPWIGATVAGRYHVLRRLGVGGHGAVYEAEHAWTRRHVAMKMLRSDRTHVAGIVERFLREAQAATQVKHPNIIDVFDMGQDGDDGPLYIVEELLVGDDLRQVLRARKRIPLAEAVAILGPVMSALDAAHRAGVVHRDVKPGNIFLTRSPDGALLPKLIDFGTSRLLEDAWDGGHQLTMTGEPVGTPAYMSPEQVRGLRAGPEVDVWAMGVVLYESLSGVRPFVAPNYGALVLRIATEDPQRLDVVAPHVPRSVANIVHRALSRRVEDRPVSMAAFLDALRVAAQDDDEGDVDTSEDRTVVTRLPVAPEPASTPPARLDTEHTPPSLPSLPSQPSHPRSTVSVAPALVAPVMVPAIPSASPLDAPPRAESSPPEVASTPVQWVASPPVEEPAPPSHRNLLIALAVVALLSLVSALVIASRRHPAETPSRASAERVSPSAQPVVAPLVAAPVVEADAASAAEPVVDTAPVAVTEPVVNDAPQTSTTRSPRTTPRVREPARPRARATPEQHPTTVTTPPPPPTQRGEYEIP